MCVSVRVRECECAGDPGMPDHIAGGCDDDIRFPPIPTPGNSTKDQVLLYPIPLELKS